MKLDKSDLTNENGDMEMNDEENVYEIDPDNIKDPFERLSGSPEEGREELSYLNTTRGGSDSRICICGHPVKRHYMKSRETGIITCNPNASPCPCKRRIAVLKSSDVRVFLRRSYGEGWLHALGQGMLKAQEKGIKLDWIGVGLDSEGNDVCELCKKTAKVMPVSLNNRNKQDLESGFNYLVCDDCMLTT